MTKRKCVAVAIAYINVSTMSRGAGKSSVAAASYRSGEKLENEREGTTYEYARKTDRVYSEMLAPEQAPEWATNRAQLWNEVEKIEKQSNARVAREVLVALPKELTQEQNIVLAKAYAQTFVNEGMVADVSMHDKGDGNPHAHIMLTTRPFNEDGSWAAKSRKEYMLDSNGEKIKLKSGEYKSRKIDSVDWNTQEKLLEWRQRYEHITNYHLAKHGYKERISVDSYEKQGIDKTPTVHLGHYAHELEQQGIETKVGTINREIQAENQQREALKQELDATLSAIAEEQQRQETLQREEVMRQHTISEEALRQKVAQWEQMAQEQMVESSLQNSTQPMPEPTGWEALKAEARRQEVIRQKTISEEAMQQRVTEWEKLAREALKQPTSEASLGGWEALKQEAARREAARENAEQEAAARRTFEQQQQRKFVKPAPDLRPFPLARPRRRHGVDWSTLAEALRSRREGHLDWAKLAEQAQAGRVDWQKLAQQPRMDWQQLAEQAEARRTDWQKLAEQQEAGRTDWQKLAEEARKQREEPKPLRDLYKQGDDEYTGKQKQRDDQDKSK